MKTVKKVAILGTLFLLLISILAGVFFWMLHSNRSKGDEIGTVNTAFHMGGSDYIAMQAVDDPLVDGVTCYYSRARVGGIQGKVGLAEDTSDASVSCLRTKEQITVRGPLPANEDILTESLSPWAKKLHIVRMVDAKRNVLAYMTHSDRIVDGSPKNSVSTVFVPLSTPLTVK